MLGLIGKAPCQADFIKVNATGPQPHAFHRWLEEGHEALRAERTRLPDGPTAFLYCGPADKTALVGVFAPSTDKVGRAFPLAVFQSLDSATAATGLASIPGACADFFEGAAALLEAAATSSLPELSTRLLALDRPIDLARGEAQRRLGSTPLGLLQEMFGGEGPLSYALRTFVTACEPERGKVPALAKVTLDCPLAESGNSGSARAATGASLGQSGHTGLGQLAEESRFAAPGSSGPPVASGAHVMFDAPVTGTGVKGFGFPEPAPFPAGPRPSISEAPAELLFWLELAQRALRWTTAPPTLLWSPSRLLLSVGPGAPTMLSFLANPAHPSSRLWPLRTRQTQAVDQARQQLGSKLRRHFDSPASTVEQLLLALVP